MDIRSQFVKIDRMFRTLHETFSQLSAAQGALDGKYSALSESIYIKYENKRGESAGRRKEINAFVLMAKDYCTVGPAIAAAVPLEPDINRLDSMAMDIDLSSRNDPAARRVIELAGNYLAYIDREEDELDRAQAQEIDRLQAEKNAESARITGKRRAILSSCDSYLRGEEMDALKRLMQEEDKYSSLSAAVLSGWHCAESLREQITFGYQQLALDVPRVLRGTMKTALGGHFDENNCLTDCPVGLSTGRSAHICIEYSGADEAAAQDGLRALAVNCLRFYPLRELKISLFDRVFYNASLLGPLSALAGSKGSVIEGVPANEEALRLSAGVLTEYYRKAERAIGADTVFDYNRRCAASERIPYRLLIYHAEDPRCAELAYLINNAQRFGITVVELRRVKDTSRVRDSFPAADSTNINISGTGDGRFLIYSERAWQPFRWLDMPDAVPTAFIAAVEKATKPNEIGCSYFKRYKISVPQRSQGLRRPISVPFAVDDDDKPVYCCFEDHNFAAYIMGAAGSGKSTLLHTIISGLLMNYHPDEVELWLLDFKMLEFKRYADHCPPHVRYLLLERSEDLVFDIIDRLTRLLDERAYLFANKYHCEKLTQIPPEENIPAVFVIIDEFAQMSQILRETRGGTGTDYTLALENLLAKGRALGLKFIFSSQSYDSGVAGLTENARNQIQMRFAMKNTPEEVKQTLGLTGSTLSEKEKDWVAALPVYQTLFKWSDADDGRPRLGRFRNMYADTGQLEQLISKLNSDLTAVTGGSAAGAHSYIDKKRVLIDGRRPLSFQSLLPACREYEAALDSDELEDGDVTIYPGVPCSFSRVRPFTLCSAAAEHILMVGGGWETELNVLCSVLNSYSRGGGQAEIWSHKLSPLYKRLRKYSGDTHICADTAQLCGRIEKLKKQVQAKSAEPRLIVCLDYDLTVGDFELMGEASPVREAPAAEKPMSLLEAVAESREIADSEERARYLAEFNRKVREYNARQNETGVRIYNAADDMKWLLKQAPSCGVHFMFCHVHGSQFVSLGLNERLFRHKLLFTLTRDESVTIAGNFRASTLEPGVGLYSSGTAAFTFRPHIHPGLPYSGWSVDDKGEVVPGIGV